uniref:Uncharacterized protein n=1 Tax=Timema shepardi TaxID=629360 RepID=A0A7R9AW58_TIMSH|nr:unnamed protein product [Timema shepardi]
MDRVPRSQSVGRELRSVSCASRRVEVRFRALVLEFIRDGETDRDNGDEKVLKVESVVFLRVILEMRVCCNFIESEDFKAGELCRLWLYPNSQRILVKDLGDAVLMNSHSPITSQTKTTTNYSNTKDLAKSLRLQCCSLALILEIMQTPYISPKENYSGVL